jgi:hypothetical protein
MNTEAFTPPPTRTFDLRQRVAIGATIPVALVAAVASFDHIRELALEKGQPVYVAWSLPLSVDGLIVIGSLLMTKARGGGKLFGSLIFSTGVLASLAANMVVAGPDPLAKAVSAWPALALLLAVEALLRFVLDVSQPDKRSVAIEAVTALANESGPLAVAEVLRSIEETNPDLAKTFAALAINDHGQAPAERPVPVESASDTALATAEPAAPDAGTPEPRPQRRRKARTNRRKVPAESGELAPELLERVRTLYADQPWLADMPKQDQDIKIAEAIEKSARTARRYRTAATEPAGQSSAPATGQAATAEPGHLDETDVATAITETAGQEPLDELATINA